MTASDILSWTYPFIKELGPILVVAVALTFTFRYAEGILSLFRRM